MNLNDILRFRAGLNRNCLFPMGIQKIPSIRAQHPISLSNRTLTLHPSRSPASPGCVIAAPATASRMLPAMTLPDGFYWTTRSAGRPEDPQTVIACDGVWVVSMSQRVDDGSWFASLDRHRHGPGGPVRNCSSVEQGRAGAELWVARHQARLRADVATLSRYRQAVRANRLARTAVDLPFSWMAGE